MTKKTTNKFSPGVRTRALPMVLDNEAKHRSRWVAVTSIAAKIGCVPQTLNEWVKKAEVDSDQRAGVPTDNAEKMKAMETHVRDDKTGQCQYIFHSCQGRTCHWASEELLWSVQR